jgi:exosome complex component RRP40
MLYFLWSSSLPFEVAIGLNGLVWVHSADCLHSIAIRNALINAQDLDDVHVEAMVHIILKRIKQAEQNPAK